MNKQIINNNKGVMESKTIELVTIGNNTALLNYLEIIAWYELPFYKRWFKQKPTKKLIEMVNQNKDE